MIVTRAAPRAHPLIREELAHRGLSFRTLVKLGVTDQPVKAVGRPPNGGLGWRGPHMPTNRTPIERTRSGVPVPAEALDLFAEMR